VLGTTLSGCWEQPGFDAGHTNWNAGEHVITAANVDQLTQLWTYGVSDGPVRSPLSIAGKVFAVGRGAFYDQIVRLDAADGRIRWSWANEQFPAGAMTDLVYRGGTLSIAWSIGPTIATRFDFNASTGASSSRSAPAEVNTAAVLDGDLVLAGGGGHPQFPGVHVGYVDGPCHVSQVGSLTGPKAGSSFAFVGDDLMWSFGTTARGFLDCDPASREYGASWTTELGGTPVGVAAVGADRVAYVDDTGTLSVLDAVTGAVVWTSEVGAGAGQPAVADGKVVVSAGSRLAVYSTTDGGLLWEAAVSGTGGTPTVGGDVVYVAVGSAIEAFALDGCGAASCTALTTVTVSSPVTGGPIVDDGRLLVGTSTGALVAFGLPA
jgi:hypothetical protein